MKRLISGLLAAAFLVLALPAQATSYGGYTRDWWVEDNRDVTFYMFDSNGLCGSTVYRLKAGQANYDEVYTSLLLSVSNGYKVVMEVQACSGTVNIIKFVKVCSYVANC